MTTKRALAVINKLREEWYRPPETYYGKKRSEFEFESYKRSAVIEIKKYLINRKRNPIKTIEEFRDMMDDFACDAKTASANFMFSVYYDVATDILDILIGTP